MAPAPVPVFDLFQSGQQASTPAARGARRGPKGSPARRETIAAATVALCAALLSVAIWVATATRSTSPADAPGAGAGEPVAAPESGPSTDAALSDATMGIAPTPSAIPAGPPSPEELAHWRSVLERVKILSAAGDIESLEAAAKALRDLKKEAPSEAHPVDLDDQIDALESRIDDLTIRRFLRSPDATP